MEKKKEKSIVRGVLIGILVSILVFILVALVVFLKQPMVDWRARHNWKEDAISKIARLASDKDWVSKEVAFVRGTESGQHQQILEEGWLSDNMILMKNGEWLVYQSHCPKAPPHNVNDICIAYGSNGKWYYTSCHFCIGMIALIGLQESLVEQDDQDVRPVDMAIFIKRYQFREFDGKSDECLKRTKAVPDGV